MSWLATLLADIAYALFQKAGLDLVAYIQAKQAKIADQKKTQAEADASVAPMIKAQTGQEIDDATRQSFDGT